MSNDEPYLVNPRPYPDPGKALTGQMHEDGSKHYIGESLPVAADSEVKPAGLAGSSPHPARADHEHFAELSVMTFSESNVDGGVITLADPLTYGGGPNWLTSSTQITIPKTGRYSFYLDLQTTRISAGLWNIYHEHYFDINGVDANRLNFIKAQVSGFDTHRVEYAAHFRSQAAGTVLRLKFYHTDSSQQGFSGALYMVREGNP